MLSKYLRHKLRQFLNGEESKEGRELFDKWYNLFSDREETPKYVEDEQDGVRRFAGIQARIQETENRQNQHIYRQGNNSMWFNLAAAICLFILAAVGIWFGFLNSTVKIKTEFGQTKVVVLPDNSKVILNANSSLSYKKQWENDNPREVWLDGEAFFEVIKTDNKQRFLVHSDNNMVVEVLGTKFSVTRRQNQYRVVLNSGKVRLKHLKESSIDTISLKPGEVVNYKIETNTFEKRAANPELYTSWRNKKFLFEETPIQEVIRLLEETYGLKVEVEEEALLRRRISGSISSHNLSNLLFGLSELYNLDIKQHGRKLTIKERKGK